MMEERTKHESLSSRLRPDILPCAPFAPGGQVALSREGRMCEFFAVLSLQLSAPTGDSKAKEQPISLRDSATGCRAGYRREFDSPIGNEVRILTSPTRVSGRCSGLDAANACGSTRFLSVLPLAKQKNGSFLVLRSRSSPILKELVLSLHPVPSLTRGEKERALLSKIIRFIPLKRLKP